MRDCIERVEILACLVLLAGRAGAIEIGGELFVDLDASFYTTGASTWANAGTYGDFDVVGDPQGGFVETTPAVWFNGVTDAFEGRGSAPSGLVRLNPTSTVEAWVFNPFVDGEETVLAWGMRGGPDGTNMSFNYGTDQSFGAVGHWGDYDVGWVGTLSANEWHHLTYTHDGEFTRVYVDGALNNEKSTAGLDTHSDPAIAIAAQWNSDLELQKFGNLAIGRLRVHDDVLTNAQILANFEEEVSYFTSPPAPEPITLAARPIHRYDFNRLSGAAEATTVDDLAGDADGEVLGDGATYTGSQLRLAGGASDTAAYVDLPNSIISKLTDATIETWVTVEGAPDTPRFFSFGSSETGEEIGPGGTGGDLDNLTLSVSRNGNLGRQYLAIKNEDPAFGGSEAGVEGAVNLMDTTIQTPLNEEFHLAFVYDSDGGSEGTPALLHYRNGELVTTFDDLTVALGNLNDVNNWIGRSNDLNEPNFQGLFNEFRIYDYALSINEIAGNIEAGPDRVNFTTGIPGDYDNDGIVDTADIDLQAAAMRNLSPDLATFDENEDGRVNSEDRTIWVHDHAGTWFGDADLSGEFDSGDMVQVFVRGKYETDETAGWEEGDWNGSGRFDTGDMVLAFVDGGYEKGARPGVGAVPEPGSVLLLVFGVLALALTGRR